MDMFRERYEGILAETRPRLRRIRGRYGTHRRVYPGLCVGGTGKISPKRKRDIRALDYKMNMVFFLDAFHRRDSVAAEEYR